MKGSFRLLVAGLLAVVLGGMARADEVKPGSTVCGSYSTSVNFEKSPTDAARRALKEEKLVMVLHVSGHFEDADFT